MARANPAIVGLAFLSVFASAITASGFAFKQKEAPSYGKQLAELNGRLFNDLELVGRGQVGVLRRVPGFFVHGGSHPDKLTKSQQDLLDFTNQVRGSGYFLEERLVVDPALLTKFGSHYKKKVADPYLLSFLMTPFDVKMTSIKEPTAFGSKSAVWSTYQKARHSAVLTNTNGVNTYASPIKFEHSECLGCHSDHKVGDLCAVYVASYKKK